ncbi:ABC transporter, permease protein [[Mycoplasma] cavipharyngis]|uniref:carbohydrate ABC transporter permease n=1 Tax=[Mycoplasma] cavipharyngis TaxID=92757 RepID=UPI003703DC2D
MKLKFDPKVLSINSKKINFWLTDFKLKFFEIKNLKIEKDKTQNKKRALKISFFVFLVIISACWIFPFGLMSNVSFKDAAQIVTNSIFALPENRGDLFKNYENAWEALNFVESFFTSLIVTILSNFFIVFLGSLAAWQLSRTKTWYSKIIFYTFLVVLIVPFQAIMLPLITIMGKLSFLNIPGLIFMYTGFGLSLSIFMMHGFMNTVPISLEEAAQVEGYNPLRIYFKIILPLLKPVITTIVILNTMWIWNDFLLPYLVFTQNSNALTTIVVNLYTKLVGTYGTDFPSLMAGLIILIIPIIIFFFIAQKNIVANITKGAIK